MARERFSIIVKAVSMNNARYHAVTHGVDVIREHAFVPDVYNAVLIVEAEREVIAAWFGADVGPAPFPMGSLLHYSTETVTLGPGNAPYGTCDGCATTTDGNISSRALDANGHCPKCRCNHDPRCGDGVAMAPVPWPELAEKLLSAARAVCSDISEPEHPDDEGAGIYYLIGRGEIDELKAVVQEIHDDAVRTIQKATDVPQFDARFMNRVERSKE